MIESAEMMFSAFHSRKVSIVTMVQLLAFVMAVGIIVRGSICGKHNWSSLPMGNWNYIIKGYKNKLD